MVKTLCFHCRECSSIPVQGTKIPHAVWPKKKKKNIGFIIPTVGYGEAKKSDIYHWKDSLLLTVCKKREHTMPCKGHTGKHQGQEA